MMPRYESCSCSASIFTFSRRELREWRDAHRHEMGGDEPEAPHIFESAGSSIEMGYFCPPEGRPSVELSLATPPGGSHHTPLGYSIVGTM